MLNLPSRLQDMLQGCTLQQNHIGHSNSLVFRVAGAKDYSAYLKVSPSNWHETLRPERDALDWLHNKMPVPEVLFYEEYQSMDYLLISEIIGLDGSNERLRAKPDELVRVYAEALKDLHALSIADCPLRQTIDKKLEVAHRLIDENLVDESDFEEEYQGWTSLQVYRELQRTRPSSEDLVFAHGDYCLPNILINKDRLSGFIDLGKAGIADRYQDVALAIRSLRHNYGTNKYSDYFLECYGIDRVDGDKVNYYILMDELY
ncbi:APH(3') family aminoglycoside O-phosphotransferase [Cohnella suwonensis]|uniref:APH(3') family aminoglycoside O-phosphotransferase n=1 Tax=Cohnella suwonensis TaxID=696072 RepID=A0ABW0M5S9_9BACL